jgi:uncharacterized protein YqgC (DUF456 family)
MASGAGLALGYAVTVALCLAGVALSAVSFSGTWFVAGAALLAMILREAPFPGWATVLSFLAICVLTEVVEFFAGAWGVTRRGGSQWAGIAAMIGGLAGMLLGGLIPLPVLGSLLGMFAGSFGLAYAVEMHRLKESGRAAHIARGAVIARVLVIILKTAASLGMAAFLLLGLLVF